MVSTFHSSIFYEKLEISYFALKLSDAQNQITSIGLSLCCSISPSAYLSSPLMSNEHMLCYRLSESVQLLVRLSPVRDVTLVFSFAKFKAKYFISSFPEKNKARAFKNPNCLNCLMLLHASLLRMCNQAC